MDYKTIKNCKNKKCNWWIPFSGYDHCLKKYILNKNKTTLSTKDLSLIYKKPINIIQDNLKKAKKEALLNFFQLNYLSNIHQIEYVDKYLDLNLCYICKNPTNLTGHLCKKCKTYSIIIYLEKRYNINAIDIYNSGKNYGNIFYNITKTTEELWKKYFKYIKNCY